MILAVDIGNTTISVGCFDGTNIVDRLRLETVPGRPAVEYERAFIEFLAGRPAEGAIISSVVPAVDEAMCEALTSLLEEPPVVMSDRLPTGIRFHHYDRRNIGADRIVDLVAARELLGAPVMVFDLGTCTTLSVLGPDDEFSGGVIMPGIQLSLDAMHAGTAKLPQLQARAPQTLIGLDTASCMESGAVIGAAAVIDGLAKRIETQLGQQVPIVLTGGTGRLVLPWCEHPVTYDPDLLLKGLYTICCRNMAPVRA